VNCTRNRRRGGQCLGVARPYVECCLSSDPIGDQMAGSLLSQDQRRAAVRFSDPIPGLL
jgi:hypothetical protein